MYQSETNSHRRSILNSHGVIKGRNSALPYLWELHTPLKVFKKTFSNNAFDAHIINLIIPAGALVVYSTDGHRHKGKMRSDRAVVHSIVNLENKKELNQSYSSQNPRFIYRYSPYTVVSSALSGEKVPLEKCVVPEFDFCKSDITCHSGIHFFLSLKKAIEYLG